MTLKSLYARAVRKLKGVVLVDSHIHPSSKVEPGSHVVGSTFDRHSYCGYDCSILYADIGAFCSLANHLTIGGAHHPLDYVSTSPVFLSHKDSVSEKFARHDYLPLVRTRIGNDVWVGDRAMIRAGVSIGDGAVVGMGSVVTRDVPPYAIVAGNPARLLRMRFEQRIIDGLLALRWWDYDDDELRRIGPLIPDPEALLREKGIT
jgi:acetyltransferase-like isoleucine patch superfamily enzyme